LFFKAGPVFDIKICRMKKQNDEERKPGGMSKIYYVFGLFMIIFYVGMAYIMIFSPIFVERISAPLRYGMGALFFLYGIFRAYRQIKDR